MHARAGKAEPRRPARHAGGARAGTTRAMADRRAEGPERVGGLVGVVLEQRRPLAVEVLGQPPVVRRREVVDHARGDPNARSRSEGVVEYVGRRQQRLDAVHVGVHPAVGVERRPRPVPLLDQHPVVVVPEAGEQHVQRRVEQLVATGSPGRRGTGRGQHHERVLVGGLRGRRPARPSDTRRTSRRARRRGTALQCRHPVVGELGAPGPPSRSAEAYTWVIRQVIQSSSGRSSWSCRRRRASRTRRRDDGEARPKSSSRSRSSAASAGVPSRRSQTSEAAVRL